MSSKSNDSWQDEEAKGADESDKEDVNDLEAFSSIVAKARLELIQARLVSNSTMMLRYGIGASTFIMRWDGAAAILPEQLSLSVY